MRLLLGGFSAEFSGLPELTMPFVETLSPQAESDRPRAKILLVEDNVLVATALAAIMTAAGHHVRCAMDGAEAEQLLTEASQDFHVVVCDLNLPRRSGRDVMKHSLSLDPKRPVIVISGAVEAEVVDELTLLGAREVLPKPVFPEELMAAVARVWDRT